MQESVEALQLLAPLDPNEVALTPLFRTNIDESMLCEIAAADYGDEAAYYYTRLKPVWETGVVTADLLYAKEVLELIRWSEPEDPKWSPGGNGSRGHWMRLFACAALVRLAPGRQDWFEGESNTLAQLVSSATELGQPVVRASASLLAWRFLADPGSAPDSAFLAFAILLLAVQLEPGDGRGLWLKQLAEWVEVEESRSRNDLSTWFSSLPHWEQWLTGLTAFDQRMPVWRSLAHRLLARPDRAHPSEARDALRLLGERVRDLAHGKSLQ